MERKFEKVSIYENVDFNLPQRKTKYSAGYDFECVEDTTIPSVYGFLIGLFLKKVTEKEFLETLKNDKKLKALFNKVITQDTSLNQAEMDKGVDRFLPYLKAQLSTTYEEMKEFTKAASATLSLVPTGVKAKIPENEYLELSIRSSTPKNTYLSLANSVGIIDSDYYNNPSNEGHIQLLIINNSPFPITLKKGDIVAQGIFKEFLITSDDAPGGERAGGFGSSSQK